MSPCLAT
ncbi:hypothetical protein ACHAW6_003465 [Cyclotella cf. meneghiniana]